MLRYDGFRIISIAGGVYAGFVVESGVIDYQPQRKYRVEKQCAFDLTILIRREPYNEDSIECEAYLPATQYDELYNILSDADQLYIEFDAGSGTLQFPVVIDKLPKLDDDARSHRSRIKFTLTSIYKQLSPIDFDSVFGYGAGWGDCWGF